MHPGTPLTGIKSGSFTIPTQGHDFSGNTRYRITLTVTDSTGLSDTKSVTVWPTKVNLSFDTAPTGLTLYLDGIARTTPFVYDTLVGFTHTVEARNQTVGSTTYSFSSWSDLGTQTHAIVVPATARSYVATYQTAIDSQPPSAPTSLAAGSVGATQLTLTWTAATDNVGVTGYRVERCQGAGCSSFAQVGTPAGASFTDTGLAASTSYSYRVRAVDAAGNLGGYSSVVSATTLAAVGPLPVAAYAFAEGAGSSVADVSGLGNAGSVGSAVWSSQGKFGNALSFDGVGARVTVPDAPSLRLTTAMTLEAWVFPTQVTNAWRDVIYKGDDNYYLMATTTPSSRPMGGGFFSGVGYGEAFGASALAANTWTHLAATYDGSMVRLYVNGVQVASKAQTGSLRTSANPLQIGGDGIYGQYFAGRIDEVRVYNVALTQTQIQTDMNTPLGGAAGDMTPPSAPTSLAAGSVGATQLTLTWTAATDNVGVTGYRVERCQGAGCSSFAQVGTPAGASFTDTGLAASTSYSYRVRAVDAAGNLGGYSSVVSATTLAAGDTTTPSAPTSLAAGSVGATQLTLTWTAATDSVGVTGYRVERCQGAGC